jgi:hypothetical protein
MAYYYQNLRPYQFRYPVYYSKPELFTGQPPSYGTCVGNQTGLLVNQCVTGTVPVTSGDNECVCQDFWTGWRGCGANTNTVCKIPVETVIPTPMGFSPIYR